MRLTPTQQIKLKLAIQEAALRYAAIATECITLKAKEQWKSEAEQARQLVHILNDALYIDVESVQLTPTAEPCGDIHCDGVTCHPIA